MGCPSDFEAVESRIDKVLTQYRESPKLLHMLRTYLRQVEMIQQAVCSLPEAFDINTAVGDQLTLLGARMGFPRTHCVCEAQPVFGFSCPTEETPVDGFCGDLTWDDCLDYGVSYLSIDDDELYRRFLLVRRYQINHDYSRQAVEQSLKIFFGEKAMVVESSLGRVVLAPMQPLSVAEQTFLQLYPRVLPVPIGVKVNFHFGSEKIFGFGDGWFGFCEGIPTDGAPLLAENEEIIYTQSNQIIYVDGIDEHPDWMCEIDVKAYSC